MLSSERAFPETVRTLCKLLPAFNVNYCGLKLLILYKLSFLCVSTMHIVQCLLSFYEFSTLSFIWSIIMRNKEQYSWKERQPEKFRSEHLHWWIPYEITVLMMCQTTCWGDDRKMSPWIENRLIFIFFLNNSALKIYLGGLGAGL